jgi:hypothetical protein
MCNKESTSFECRGVARRECTLSSAQSVGTVSSCDGWDSCCEIIGTLSGRKICVVSRSVCTDPRSVGYICKSSVDTGQADTSYSNPEFTSTCMWGGLASFPAQLNDSCYGVGKWFIHTFWCRIIVDCWWLKSKFLLHGRWLFVVWKQKLTAQVSLCELNIAESNGHTVRLHAARLL